MKSSSENLDQFHPFGICKQELDFMQTESKLKSLKSLKPQLFLYTQKEYYFTINLNILHIYVYRSNS
jgi:hypothetical protein